MVEAYDVVIIGAGPVAENVADRVVQGGLTAVLIERELVGGECSYWACIPSKALLRSGAAVRAALNVDGARQSVTGGPDVAAVLKRRDSFAHDWDDASQVAWAEGAGIEVLRGHGRLVGVRRVEVTAPDGTVTGITARHAVVVSTGSDPVLPDIPGLAEAQPWMSRDATSAQSIPRRLAIIGGGVLGAEMATAYASLGCEVTLIARSRLLGTHEPFVGELVRAGLGRLGVDVRIGVSPDSAMRRGETVILELSDGSQVTADEVLVAAGRQPRTSDIGLASVGLTPGDWLHVDDTLMVTARTNAPPPWLYATGDVNHRALLTHQGKYQARAAGDVIVARSTGGDVDDAPWGAHAASADNAAVPQVVFSEPEVASIGLTSEAARRAGFEIRVVDCELGEIAGPSLHADGYSGRARMVVDEKRHTVIGMTFVGQDVSEMLHAATVAIVGEVPVDRLWHAVPAYPTMNEAWLRLLEAYGRPIGSL